MIHCHIMSTIGRTAVIRLNRFACPGGAQIHLKHEGFNPGGSVKDRSALGMIEAAEVRGELKPGDTIVESSSGNLAIALAMVCAVKGYRVILLVDPRTPPTNVAMVRAFGAEVMVVDEKDEDGGYQKTRLRMAGQLARSLPAFWPNQYSNPDNVMMHYWTTAREIAADFPSPPDVVVATISTAGHICGIGKFFREHHPQVRIIGVDAYGSVVMGGKQHTHLITGIGLSWVPGNLDRSLIDRGYLVSDQAGFTAARMLARTEGILAGGSTGAALYLAREMARRMSPQQNICVVSADRGEKYLDTFYNDQWLIDRGLSPFNDCEHLVGPQYERVL